MTDLLDIFISFRKCQTSHGARYGWCGRCLSIDTCFFIGLKLTSVFGSFKLSCSRIHDLFSHKTRLIVQSEGLSFFEEVMVHRLSFLCKYVTNKAMMAKHLDLGFRHSYFLYSKWLQIIAQVALIFKLRVAQTLKDRGFMFYHNIVEEIRVLLSLSKYQSISSVSTGIIPISEKSLMLSFCSLVI